LKYIELAATSFILLCTLDGVGQACSCVQGGTVCSEYAQASAVFVGVATDISTATIKRGDANHRDDFPGKVVRFSIEHAFKGVQSPEVFVETGNGGGDCGYPFESGKSYLVYCYAGTSDTLRTGICSRTKLTAKANEDLDYLRGFPESASKSRLSGTVIQETNERDSTGFKKMESMSGVKITVTGGGRHFEAFTDDQGVYMVILLPAGKYRVSAVLPGNLRLVKWDKKDFVETEVPPGGCAAADLLVETDGGIEGRVFDSSGKPAKGIQVDLVPVKFVGTTLSSAVIESQSEQSDKQGVYRFTGINPGQYYLGVNLRDEPTSLSQYNRTYYPGAHQRDGATVIELRDGEKLTGYDLILPPAMALRTIEGVFTWANGQFVRPGSISLQDSAEADRTGRVYAFAEVDEKGHFSVKAFDGLECWVHATTYYTDGQRMQFVNIAPVKIVVNASTPPLKLVAPVPDDMTGKKLIH